MYQLANHEGRQRSMNGMKVSSPDYSGTTSYEAVRLAVQRMICWLDKVGESSQDLYDFYATKYGNWQNGFTIGDRRLVPCAWLLWCLWKPSCLRRDSYFGLAPGFHWLMPIMRWDLHTCIKQRVKVNPCGAQSTSWRSWRRQDA